MTRNYILTCALIIASASSVSGQYLAPAADNLDGPAVTNGLDGYQDELSTTNYDRLKTYVSDPGADTDDDGVTDLQEFLIGGYTVVDQPDGLKQMSKFNLALAMATDWTTIDSGSTTKLRAFLDQVAGASTPLATYLPGLSPTLETQFHQELAELAKELEYDPARIYEWVYANVEFEDYALSRKGALATFRTLRGNEWDQCNLLIALLRMSGVPARYVIGQSYESVSGESTTLKDVVFVQAWLPASPYNIPGQDELDSPHRAWLTFAPWDKTLQTITEGNDLFSHTATITQGLDITKDISSSDAYLDPSTSVASDFDAHTQKTSTEYLEDRINTYLITNHPGQSIKDVLRVERIVSTPSGGIPTSLPHNTAEWVETPAGTDLFYTDTADTASSSVFADRRASTEIRVSTVNYSQVSSGPPPDPNPSDPFSPSWETSTDPNINPQILANWRLDETSGTIAYDSASDSGSVNEEEWDGTRAPAGGWQAVTDTKVAPVGTGYLSFDGINDSIKIASRNNSSNQDPPLSGHAAFSEYSISLWIKPDSDILNNPGNYILYEEGGGDHGIALRLSVVDNSPELSMKIQAAVLVNGDAPPPFQPSIYTVEYTISSAITSSHTFFSTWNHVVLMFRHNTNPPLSSPNGYLTLRLNGAPAASIVDHIPTVPFHGDPGSIGVRRGEDAFLDTAAAKYYKGDMDDIRVYYKALTNTQAGDLYALRLVEVDEVAPSPPSIIETVTPVLTQRIYLPQIAGRRLMLAPSTTGGNDYESVTPTLSIDGQELIEATGSVIPIDNTDPLGADQIRVEYRRPGDPYVDATFKDWSRRPLIRPGAMVNITLDTLNASVGRMAEIKRDLDNLETQAAFDTDSATKQEAYLGRLASLMSETYQLRVWESEERLNELMHVSRVDHNYTQYVEPDPSTATVTTDIDINTTFNMLWTYPREANSFINTGEFGTSTSGSSTYLTLAAWRNDNFRTKTRLLKLQNDPTADVLIDESNDPDVPEYWTTVSGMAGSYYESLIFDDWQGTPSLSTVRGIFAAIDDNITVKTYNPGQTSTIASDLTLLDSDLVDQIISEVGTAGTGAKVTVPVAPVSIKDQDGNTLIESSVRIVEYADGSIAWKFGQFNGGGSGVGFNLDEYNNFNIAQPIYIPGYNTNEIVFDFSTDENLSTTIPASAYGYQINNIGDPVNAVTGEFYLEEPSDISIRSRGFTLDITRRYGSRIIYNGPFGYGWGWSHADTLLIAEKDGEDVIVYSDASRKPAEIIEHSDTSFTYPPGTTYEIVKIFNSLPAHVGYEIRFKDGRITRFTTDGLLEYKEDAQGNRLTFIYDQTHSSRIIAIRDSLNRELTLSYNNNGKVVAATDYTGRSTRYGYDGSDLIWFEDLEGNVYRYEYLKDQDFALNNHNLSKQILPNGDFLEIFYYKNDTTSHHTNSKGDTFHFQYSWLNRYAETWNESGYYRKLFWNENWDVIRILTEDDAVEHSEYDDKHNLLSRTDGNGNKSVFQYEADERELISSTNPEGETQAFEYNDQGRPTKVYTQTGPITQDGPDYYIDVVETESVYDNSGTLLEELHTARRRHKLKVDAEGVPVLSGNSLQFKSNETFDNSAPEYHVTEYAYDNHGNLLSTTEKLVHPGTTTNDLVTTHIYDVNGLNRVRTEDPESNLTHFIYDDLSRMIAVTDADGFTTQVEYNAYGQPARTVDATGAVTTNDYDVNRRLVKTTNPEGAVSTVEYGIPFYGRNFERVTTETDPLGHTTRHEYDAVGDRIATTDPNGNTTRLKYDKLNRPIEIIDALGNISRNRYDAAGNLIETVDAHGNAITFSYDKANRLVRRREMWREQRAMEYVYDERGNVLEERRGYYRIDPTPTDTENGDWALPGGSTEANLVLQGPITTTHTYDRRNRRETSSRYADVAAASERKTTIVYDSLSRVREQIEYGASEVDQNATPSNANDLRRTTFTYDDVGNLTDQKVFDRNGAGWATQPDSHIYHEYDNRNLRSLTAVKDPDHGSYPGSASNFRETRFTYDAAGRQRSSTVSVGDAAGVTPTDRITESEYDGAGNVVLTITKVDSGEVSRSEFSYNKRNEIVSTTNALGHTRTFTYDANGNQVTATDAEGFTTRVFYDALNRQVSTQDALNNTTTFDYDALGNMISTVTPLGERTTSLYNENNELIEQVSPLENHDIYVEDGISPVKFVYDVYGRVVHSIDARGNKQNITVYNDFDEPTTVSSKVTPLGVSQDTLFTYYGYDGLGRVRLVIDARDTDTRTEYDVLGQVIKLTQADGVAGQETISEFQYDVAGNRVTEVRASDGNFTNYAVGETTTTFLYDELNRLIKSTVKSATSSEDLETVTTYDDANRKVTTTDPFDVVQSTTFDEAGRQVSLSLGGDVITTWEYDRRGLVTRTDTPEASPTVFVYDPRGQLIKQIVAHGSAEEATASYEYDANGQQVRMTDPLGYVTVTHYDVAGRVIHTIEAFGQGDDEAHTKFNYDANGNLLSVVDAEHVLYPFQAAIDLNEFAFEAVRYEYDELNRQTHHYDFGSRSDTVSRPVEKILYDDNGNASKTTLRDDRIIERYFDKLNRVTAIDDITDSLNDFTLQTFTYDKQSRIELASDTNADAPSQTTQTVEYTYDFAGRLTEEAGYDGTDRPGPGTIHAHAVETSYSTLSGAFSRSITKEFLGDGKQSTSIDRTFLYREDTRGLLKDFDATDIPNFDGAAYSYDDNARLNSVIFDNNGQAGSLTLAYDARGREAHRAYTAPAGNVDLTPFTQATTYDRASNVEREVVKDKINSLGVDVNHDFTYDPQHRLTAYDRVDITSTIQVPQITWDHDRVGNWKSSNQNNTSVTENFTADDDNQYTAVGAGTPSTNHHYDDRGNLTYLGNPSSPADGDVQFSYDWSNRLVEVEERVSNAWTTLAEYEYDALNRRVAKRVAPTSAGTGGELTLFAYDGSRVAFEMYHATGNRGSTALARSYAYGNYLDEPAMMIDEAGTGGAAGARYYYLHDRRYSVVALADSTGKIVERYRYEAFGEMTVYETSGTGGQGTWSTRASQPNPNESAYGNPYGFTGRRYDPETATTATDDQGLWHYRNRMYAATLGRFLQRDPAGYIDGYNLYAYVRNNPMRYLDALGLKTEYFDRLDHLDAYLGQFGYVDPVQTSIDRDLLNQVLASQPIDANPQIASLPGPSIEEIRNDMFIANVKIKHRQSQLAQLTPGEAFLDSIYQRAVRVKNNAVSVASGTVDFAGQSAAGFTEVVHPVPPDFGDPTSTSGGFGRSTGRAAGLVFSIAEVIGGSIGTVVFGSSSTVTAPAVPVSVPLAGATVLSAGITAHGATGIQRYSNLEPVNVRGQSSNFAKSNSSSNNVGGSVGSGHTNTPPKLTGHLHTKLRKVNTFIRQGGNTQITGRVTQAEARKLAENYIGPGFTETISPKGQWILRSQDGLRKVRGPSVKPTTDLKNNIDPRTLQPYSKTGTQMNFEARDVPDGEYGANVHLDVESK